MVQLTNSQENRPAPRPLRRAGAKALLDRAGRHRHRQLGCPTVTAILLPHGGEAKAMACVSSLRLLAPPPRHPQIRMMSPDPTFIWRIGASGPHFPGLGCGSVKPQHSVPTILSALADEAFGVAASAPFSWATAATRRGSTPVGMIGLRVLVGVPTFSSNIECSA